jgi:hypothetical protein
VRTLAVQVHPDLHHDRACVLSLAKADATSRPKHGSGGPLLHGIKCRGHAGSTDRAGRSAAGSGCHRRCPRNGSGGEAMSSLRAPSRECWVRLSARAGWGVSPVIVRGWP